MPLRKKWRSLDLFGSHDNLFLNHHHRAEHLNPFRKRLSSLSGSKEEVTTPKKEDSPDGSQLVQRCVIIQRDEKGYGLTVSGDNPVFVQSVKADGAAARAGVQQHDRIIKVNGTLVTSRNHIDVVKLIKSGSYVALTLLGKPQLSGSGSTIKHTSFRDSSGGRITAPQPVDPEKDRELWQQKVHTTQAMYEHAKEDYEKIQKSFLKNPSEKLHGQLIEKEKTLKKLDSQLKQFTGGLSLEPMTPGSTPSPGHPSVSDPDHMDPTPTSWVSRWGRRKLKRAASVPISCSDGGSVSDSPHTSPSISPTPTHPSNCHTEEGVSSVRGDISNEDVIPPSQQNIIIIDDEDFNSEEEPLDGPRNWPSRPLSPFLHRLQALEGGDPGPFGSIDTLEKKPAHLAIFLHYLISNSDPSSLFFYIVSDMYCHAQGSAKDLRKWAYEIHSTFLVHDAPLKVELDNSIVTTIDCILTQSSNENSLRPVFDQAKMAVKTEIAELLNDFCNKKDLGLGSIYGVHELEDVMEKSKELKIIDKYLSPHLERCTKDNVKINRDQAIGWALATFLRYVGFTKGPSIERTQSFVMKDKRLLKLPGKSNKAKQFKGHIFNLTHYTSTTFCSLCNGLIWGVGTQGLQCQVCELNVHKQCSEDADTCVGKQKKGDRDKDKKRASAVIPVVPFAGRKQSNPNKDAGAPPSSTVQEALADARHQELQIVTQPVKRDEEADFSVLLSKIAGLPAGHGVKSIIQRYEDGPKSPTENPEAEDANQGKDRELGRSESMKGRGEVTKLKKGDRPARRAKSDVDMDDNTIKALNQSGSSSTSSLSNRSVESPSNSTETVHELIANDSDLDVESELPSLKSLLGDDVIKKLKPKEKKRQEVLNELFYTERAHVRSLKIIDRLFHRPMAVEGSHHELARYLFPNLDQMIELHRELNNQMRKRRQENPVVTRVADLLLTRFDGENGEIFRQACAEYCRNQSFALENLKKHQRKEQRLSLFLNEAESSPLCRRLQLKDLMPAQMQRLTKYPLLIDNLMKYTQANSEEHSQLERARDRSRQILAYVNQAVKDCENYHRSRVIQKKIDKRPIENMSSHQSYEEMKNLDVTQHKLVHDGVLSMKLRSHRMMDVHVVLLENIMVLLQKQDDKLVLCQSNAQSSRAEDKFVNTHSPLLKLQNLLARNVATDKKAFFVVNTENSGPQIYEFVAPTQDERKKWMKYINDSVEEVKKREGSSKFTPFVPPKLPPAIVPPPGNHEPETISLRRDQIRSVSSPQNNTISTVSPLKQRGIHPYYLQQQIVLPTCSWYMIHGQQHRHMKRRGHQRKLARETADMTQTSESTLIQPHEVHISDPVVGQAEQVLTPIEKLRRNDESLEASMEEREKILAQIQGLPIDETRGTAEVDTVMGGNHDDNESSSLFLIKAAQEINSQLMQLVINSNSNQAPMASPSSTPQTPHSGAARAEQPKVTIPIPMEQLRDMAIRMNQILTKLLSAVNNQEEEKEGLREELRQAQEKLTSLRQIQMAVMGGSLPHSRPSSIVSAGSSATEEEGAAQVPSVNDVANSLREQAQEMMSAVGLTRQDDELEKKTSAAKKTPLSSSSSLNGEKVTSSTPVLANTATDSDSDDHDYVEIPDDLPPLNEERLASSNNNSEGDTLKTVSAENSKNEVVSATGQFADKAEIESVISQEMMSSTQTTDLDEGANDSDSESTPTSIPNLGDLGETDTDSVQKFDGVVLPGGISAEELMAGNQTKPSTGDEKSDMTLSSKESAVDPIEI
ncbi:LOW QUALITY PROTEIN: rho guanine nucleotide exchange factor 11-like [Haliotis rubra]|uniref:LOW QUALITY PROTEIN: rho guanine nucleotide exchange factor 11-like n=1 Tax=Haliotis rubra TaxID=36100 RepID=UPI001EE54728|nr:LOW QUALITY PROTEIN: rho guanine nucleotide exchange factor 11-like [Haliotis rubra]